MKIWVASYDLAVYNGVVSLVLRWALWRAWMVIMVFSVAKICQWAALRRWWRATQTASSFVSTGAPTWRLQLAVFWQSTSASYIYFNHLVRVSEAHVEAVLPGGGLSCKKKKKKREREKDRERESITKFKQGNFSLQIFAHEGKACPVGLTDSYKNKQTTKSHIYI